jgi:hypothetical protein
VDTAGAETKASSDAGRVKRPRVRDLAGQELSLPSWDRAVAEDWVGKCEPDADQRLDAEIPPCAAASRGRCSGPAGAGVRPDRDFF